MLIVSLGNALAADDGLGPAVAAALRDAALPAGVRVEDGGTDALRLPSLWRGEPRVWLIDAFILGAAPGTVHRLEHDDLLALPQRHEGAHALSLPECLRLLALSNPEMAGVRYTLWGVEPAEICPRSSLSPAVAAAVPALAAAIRAARTSGAAKGPRAAGAPSRSARR